MLSAPKSSQIKLKNKLETKENWQYRWLAYLYFKYKKLSQIYTKIFPKEYLAKIVIGQFAKNEKKYSRLKDT